jgi:hypothetical protein
MGGSTGKMRDAHKVLVGKPGRKSSFAKTGLTLPVILKCIFGK